MSKWVRFEFNGVSPSGRTKRWLVITKTEPPSVLGAVTWFASWRCYAFYPKDATVYERQCLRDLADFCESKTQEQRTARQLRSLRGATGTVSLG